VVFHREGKGRGERNLNYNTVTDTRLVLDSKMREKNPRKKIFIQSTSSWTRDRRGLC
jgi:hypothetical protein